MNRAEAVEMARVLEGEDRVVMVSGEWVLPVSSQTFMSSAAEM